MWELRCANIKELIRCLLLCCYFEWFANRMNRLQWGRCGCKWGGQHWWLWAVMTTASSILTNMVNCPFDGAFCLVIHISLQAVLLWGFFKKQNTVVMEIILKKKKKKKKKALISPHQSTTGNVTAETRCERINSSADPCHNLHGV